MKLSPIQLIESKFVKISVELNEGFVASETSATDNSVLDIEHMMHIERQEGEPNDKTVPKYVLALGIRTGGNTHNRLPYLFELVVTAIIAADPRQFAADNNIDDSAAKFGFSILYGQIRELLTTMTGRMNAGPLTLPTMSFMDITYPTAGTNQQV